MTAIDKGKRASITVANDLSPVATDNRFELTTFFSGRTHAWGVFEDRFGRLQRRFYVDMEGVWDGDTFILRETFTYDTSDVENRTWRVKPDGQGRFLATCAECVGVAKGVCERDSISMQYKFKLSVGGRNVVVDFQDKLYRMGASKAINRTVMRKWGVKLGELSLFFERQD